MKFRTTELRSQEKVDFFEDVIYADGKIQKSFNRAVKTWINNLKKYKQIEIYQFKDLLRGWEEITFPITITKSYSTTWSLGIEFVDNDKKVYEMWKRGIISYVDIQNYYIYGESLTDKRWKYYSIFEDGTIVLTSLTVMQLKTDGTIRDVRVSFDYDIKNKITEVIREQGSLSSEIKIKYQTVNEEFDEKIMLLLFSIKEVEGDYYDVLPILILKMLTETLMTSKELSISITAEINKEVFSKIAIVHGIVQEWITTRVINEGEFEIKRKIFAKDLKEFLEDCNI